MKKLLAIVLVLVLFASAACAEPWPMFSIKFNSSMKYFGLEEVDGSEITILSVNTADDTFYITRGAYDFAATFDGDNVASFSARLLDESAEMDYTMLCLAAITALGDIDFSAYGNFMISLADARQGRPMGLGGLNMDSFAVSAGEDGVVYQFTYLNKDKMYAP